MAQCPYINTEINDSASNQRTIYSTANGGEYVYWLHADGFGKVYPAQFCRHIGRKRDVFECLNEGEWKCCPHYISAEKRTEKPDA